MTYEIRAKASDVRVAVGTGQKILFSVRRNGVYVPPEKDDGGRLVMCARSVWGARTDWSIIPVSDQGEPVGWIVLSGSDGSPSFHTAALVTIPPEPSVGGEPRPYFETPISMREAPAFRRSDAGVEVWSTYPWSGGAGTACSIEIPEQHLITSDGRVSRAALDPDWTTWHPAFASAWFGHAYIAGLQQENAPLMRRAIAALHEPGHDSWLEAVGLPHERDGLVALADAIDGLALARRRVAELSGD